MDITNVLLTATVAVALLTILINKNLSPMGKGFIIFGAVTVVVMALTVNGYDHPLYLLGCLIGLPFTITRSIKVYKSSLCVSMAFTLLATIDVALKGHDYYAFYVINTVGLFGLASIYWTVSKDKDVFAEMVRVQYVD